MLGTDIAPDTPELAPLALVVPPPPPPPTIPLKVLDPPLICEAISLRRKMPNMKAINLFHRAT